MEKDDKQEQEIFSRLARLCAQSEQCSPDIRKKVADLGGDKEMAMRIVERLEKEKFLNDERFVRSYVSEKFRVNKWGRVKINYYLRMKGLSDQVIGKGFEEIDEDQYIRLLISTMKEKAVTIKKTNKFEKMGQIIRFTQGRGFEPELIHRYMNMVME